MKCPRCKIPMTVRLEISPVNCECCETEGAEGELEVGYLCSNYEGCGQNYIPLIRNVDDLLIYFENLTIFPVGWLERVAEKEEERKR